MIYVLYFVHVLVCLFLILVVLLQQGKGADLSVFGGGSTMAAFGARGATTLLHKLAVGSFVVFTITTLAIAILQGRATGSSVMAGEKAASGAPAPAETPTTTPAPPVEGVPPPAQAVPPSKAPAGQPATPPAGQAGQQPPPATQTPPPGQAGQPAAVQPPPAPSAPPPGSQGGR